MCSIKKRLETLINKDNLVLLGAFLTFGFAFFKLILPLFKKYKCEKCFSKMEKHVDNENRIILKCPSCEHIKKLDIYMGGSD